MASPKTCTPADIAIGQRIAALRSARCHSQTALGRVLGVSFQQIQKYEAGKNKISAGRLIAVAQFLGVKVKDLAPDVGEPEHRELTIEELRADYLRAKAAYEAGVRRELQAGVEGVN
jgi:transcriptional regulator with XRE-family HTH domain